MQYNQYTNVNAFHTDVSNLLMRHEAQNVIPLGNIIIGVEGKDKEGWRDPANWYMATVSDETGIKLVAIMTPPHNITLYATDNQNNPEALRCLCNNMAQNNISTPGVMAEKSLAELFAQLYATSYKVTMAQRIYELTEVNPQIPTAPLRLATERDLAFVPYWDAGFFSSTVDGQAKPIEISENLEQYRYHIRTGRLYIMEDKGIPVTMAKISRDLENVCVIGYVYTPPYFRKKGYATACVAAVSQIGLDRGFKKCVLYTDLANPTSNSIYQKIGYKPICDSVMIGFE